MDDLVSCNEMSRMISDAVHTSPAAIRLIRASWRRRIGRGPGGGWVEGERLREVIQIACDALFVIRKLVLVNVSDNSRDGGRN
jgi:hypothetical protein